ncbi:MAG: Unknown protein [uncultured Sulfurovum sp.]|uniref:Uncharacterized protein n=1 Tax=uncultured Sulfurovum sp. TaxID=269237 RepID=A0A6S6SH11_9BACT|nr:MAG: Unknown protein [uncultured Sulfurovum sp.]
MKNCNNKAGFAQIVNNLYDIKDELLIVASIDNELKVIAPIADDIIAITPYTNDIETVSKNIQAVKDAYANASASLKNASDAERFAIISENAKSVSVEKAREANDDAKEAHLSALYASERAEWIKINTNPILEHIELIKLSPENARIAKESAEIATRAKDISIEKAREANADANQAHLSALYASERAEHVDGVSNYIDNRKIEIVGIVNELKEFIAISTDNIDEIKSLLLRRSSEVEIARNEALQSAVSSTEAKKLVNIKANFVESVVPIVREQANTAIKASADAKRYGDETKALSLDFEEKSTTFLSEGRDYRDETKTMYEALKEVGSVYQIHKEIYTMRTGVIYEIRGEL